jgi:hypothetical protein
MMRRGRFPASGPAFFAPSGRLLPSRLRGLQSEASEEGFTRVAGASNSFFWLEDSVGIDFPFEAIEKRLTRGGSADDRVCARPLRMGSDPSP